jgi:hypothetical protein
LVWREKWSAMARGLGLDVGPERVIALEAAHGEIVRVHVLARGDRLAGEPDDLVVAPHRLAGGDGAHRDLVAGRDQAADRDVLDGGAADQLRACDQHVVIGMESDEGRHQ